MRSTHTFAELEIPALAFLTIKKALEDVGQEYLFRYLDCSGGKETIHWGGEVGLISDGKFDGPSPFVFTFAERMLKEIGLNRAKGDFMAWTPNKGELFRELHYHLDKMEQAMHREDQGHLVEEFSADSANYLLKVFQLWGVRQPRPYTISEVDKMAGRELAPSPSVEKEMPTCPRCGPMGDCVCHEHDDMPYP